MRSNSGTPSSFNFESKIYDIEYDNDNDDEECDKIEDNTIDRIYNDNTALGSKTTLSHNNELSKLKDNKFTLSQDILLGEPGDVVDLSSPNVGYNISHSNKSFVKEDEDEDEDEDEEEEEEDTRRNVSSVTSLSTTPRLGKIALAATIDRSALVTPPPLPAPPPSVANTIEGCDLRSTTPISRKMEISSISDGMMQIRLGDDSSIKNNNPVRKHSKKKSRLSVFINNLFK